jgi:hypothetical protein
MGDESTGGTPPTAEDEEVSPIVGVAKKASRFSREFIVTVISVVTTAFGVVVALAWNSALSEALASYNSKAARIWGHFLYALLITFLAVLAIIFLGRLATRIGAEPIQFGIPPKKKE